MAPVPVPDGRVCARCGRAAERQARAALACAACGRATHAACARPPPPGALSGDVFYQFTCALCAPAGRDCFLRPPLHWVNILILVATQLNVTSYATSKQGFFHYKTHIANFIDRNWTLLFGKCKKKKKWLGTVVSVLSHYDGTIFQSGLQFLGEPGWWRLLHTFSPAVAMHIVQELSQYNHKNKGGTKIMEGKSIDKNVFLNIVVRLGYEHLLSDGNTDATHSEEDIPTKKRKLESECSGISSTYSDNNHDSDSRNEADEKTSNDFTLDQESEDFALNTIERHCENQVNLSTSYPYQASSSAFYDSDSRSRSPVGDRMRQSEESDHKHTDYEDKPRAKEAKEKPQIVLNKTSLFSKELNSVGELPWLKPLNATKETALVRLNEYEEIQLLRRVESLIPDAKNAMDKAYLRRLRAKLALRRLKRNKHLPLFDLDQTVKYLAGYSTLDPRFNTVTSERVLDRFQTSYLDNPSRAELSPSQSTILMGRSDPTPFQSPYSGSMLKPFIRRDGESTPLWLRVMDELLQKMNKNNPDYVPQPRATIDYSYVRPQHIAAVNNMCVQFFWPGVDLTEVMQYPEFSCVVTYKKLVIGFAFLVPDVGFNQVYISFLLTRPEWRNAKIATFMLYHLLQTCAGKDVLLHVSPTNPAVFLYQKFGFKVEELIQDFYEKYFEITSKECRHALLLRLTR